MQIQSSQKIKTSIFVITGLAILLLLIFFIGNQKNLFRNAILLHINYRTVAGLQEGNYVRFAGINVGSVEYIEIINDTTVMVTISVQKKLMRFIRTDSRASIANVGLLGDKLIQLSSGSFNSPLIKENGELIAINPFDMDKIMAKVENAAIKIERIISNVDTLSGNLSIIFGKINNGNGTLSRLLNNNKLSSELEETISSAKITVKNLDLAAGGVHDNMEAVKHNFLIRGYFKGIEKKRINDSLHKARTKYNPIKEKK